MKCFICALDKINLGIPAERTERIISVDRVQTKLLETENKDAFIEAFIFLPGLFQQKDIPAPHGLVLKTPVQTTASSSETKIRTVLLTPKIDVELEIPDDGIRRLPQTLGGWLSFFSGAYFNDQNMILILNPEKLIEGIKDIR